MPKQPLTGSLDEQCEFLYQLAQEKIESGNYTGAIHALQEIVKHAPEYKDAASLLAWSKRRKAEQRNLLLFSLLGAALFVGAGTAAQVANDLILLILAFVGLLVGFGVANLVRSLQERKR